MATSCHHDSPAELLCRTFQLSSAGRSTVTLQLAFDEAFQDVAESDVSVRVIPGAPFLHTCCTLSCCMVQGAPDGASVPVRPKTPCARGCVC